MAKIKRNNASSKNDSKKNMTRNVLIILAVVLAVGMVGSYMTTLFNPSGYYSNTDTVAAGDTVTIGYTIFNDYGYPVLTTFDEIVEEAVAQNLSVLQAPPLEIPAGVGLNETDIVPLPTDPEVPGFDQFGLLGFEFNSISSGVIGMELGGGEIIAFDYGGVELVYNVSKDDFNDMYKDTGVDFSQLQTGSMLTVGISTTPVITVDEAEAPTTNFRIATVTQKNDDFAVLKNSYPGAQVFVLSLAE